MFTAQEIRAAQDCVYASLRPTPQYAWPLLSEALGAKVWVKHESKLAGVIAATRGNHGQSIAFAAGKVNVPATIVVPHGNSREKNAAMRTLGAQLIEHGAEFQEAKEHAVALSQQRGLHFVPSYHRDLLLGVMTYWVEFFEAVQPDVTYVPIGMGSGFCAAAAARAHTGVKTKLIGVVSAHATAYQDSFKARKLLKSPVSTVIADGMACPRPRPSSAGCDLQRGA